MQPELITLAFIVFLLPVGVSARYPDGVQLATNRMQGMAQAPFVRGAVARSIAVLEYVAVNLLESRQLVCSLADDSLCPGNEL